MKSCEIIIRILKISLFCGFVLGMFASCASDESTQLRKELRDEKMELNMKDPARFPEPDEIGNVLPLTGRTIKNSIGMEFIEIPAGEFLIGCSKDDTECEDDEKPQHMVKITKPFYLGKFEVTQGEWKKVMGSNPSIFVNCGENCPVESVSWIGVHEFIERLCIKENQNPCKYRLPTEAEWEYAARAGSMTKYYWGDTFNDAYLWYYGNSADTTHPDGKKKPNAWGLYDMSGNVYEWVGDWYGSDYYKNGSSNDPKGPNSGENRVLRGGSWSNKAKSGRLSYRDYFKPDSRNINLGFRLFLLP